MNLITSLFFSGFIFCLVIIVYFFYENYHHQKFEKKLIRLKQGEALQNSKTSDYQKITLKNHWKVFLSKASAHLQSANKSTNQLYRQQFEKCGWDSEYAAIIAPSVQIAFIFLLLGSYFIAYTVSEKVSSLSYIAHFAISMICVFIGYRSFDYIIDLFTKIRLDTIERSIPMVIDLLGICTESGLTFDRSLDKIAQEIVYNNVSLARELALTVAELSILPERRVAYTNLYKRVPLEIIHNLTNSMIQAEEHGASIGKTLNTLSEENMRATFYKIEVKAGKLPAKMTIPIIVFGLPIIIILLLGPAVSRMISNGFLN